MDNSSALAVSAASAVIAAAVFVGLIALGSRRSRRRMPPGPPLDPIIGGLRIMPSTHQWLTFSEWSKRWGAGAIWFSRCPLRSYKRVRRRCLYVYLWVAGDRIEFN